jgi:carotenoid cleavage dioxygenase-like enzyme
VLPLNVSSKTTVYVEPIKLVAIDMHGKEYGSELVRINELFKGRKYRYSYGFTGFAGDGEEKGGFNDWAIIKLDHYAAANMQQSSCKIWKSPNCFPSETVFVPQKLPPFSGQSVNNSESEDDGILISQVYDTEKRETFLLLLNAKNMTELARCYTGERCPISFHGCFIQN